MSAPILVVGTNVELLALAVAEVARCHVVALVTEQAPLALVRAQAGLRRVEDLVEFQVGCPDSLPFVREAFSAVVAKSLRTPPGSHAELDELVRVLAPGGTFVAIEDIDEWSSTNAIGFAMDFWHRQLKRYRLEHFQIRVARFVDIYAAQKSTPIT